MKMPPKQTIYLQPDVFPPHGAVEAPRIPLEGERLSLQAVRGLHQQFNPLPPFQHLRAPFQTLDVQSRKQKQKAALMRDYGGLRRAAHIPDTGHVPPPSTQL